MHCSNWSWSVYGGNEPNAGPKAATLNYMYYCCTLTHVKPGHSSWRVESRALTGETNLPALRAATLKIRMVPKTLSCSCPGGGKLNNAKMRQKGFRD